jgi:hypothetical protein
MTAATVTIPRALALILVSRNLERVADSGEDVRERGDRELRKGPRLAAPDRLG